MSLHSLTSFLVWVPGNVPTLQILISVTIWATIYFLCLTLLPKCSAEYSCRLVTLFHGVAITSISAVLHFYYGPAPWNNLGQANRPIHNLVLLSSLGYFLFDFSWCMLAGSESGPMLAHHLVSIFGLGYSTYLHKYGAEVTAVCFGAEISNPMLQLRWFLRQHNQYHSRIGVLNDYLFVFSFAFWRFVLGSYFLYRAMQCDQIDIVIKSGGAALYCISAVFMWHIAKFFIRKYILKLKKPQKKD